MDARHVPTPDHPADTDVLAGDARALHRRAVRRARGHIRPCQGFYRDARRSRPTPGRAKPNRRRSNRPSVQSPRHVGSDAPRRGLSSLRSRRGGKLHLYASRVLPGRGTLERVEQQFCIYPLATDEVICYSTGGRRHTARYERQGRRPDHSGASHGTGMDMELVDSLRQLAENALGLYDNIEHNEEATKTFVRRCQVFGVNALLTSQASCPRT